MDNYGIIMENTSGFYKKEDGVWIYAPNFVYGLNLELLRENKDTYTYPIEGWNWFDNAPQEYLDQIANSTDLLTEEI